MEQKRLKREFYTLLELCDEWQVAEVNLHYWLVTGQLRAQVWVPLLSVFESRNGRWGELQHFEGFAILSRYQCQRLFRRDQIGLRSFSRAQDGSHYLLPDTSDDVVITVDELLILEGEKMRFEGASLRRAPSHQNPNFQRLEWKGTLYHFGPVQRRCLELLYEAAQTDQSWLNGKQLLYTAGSQSFSLSNLFKRKPIWRELVESDGRGNYRMLEMSERSGRNEIGAR